MISQKNLNKKIFLSLLILGILISLVYAFHINQDRFGGFELDKMDIHFSDFLKDTQKNLFPDKIINYSENLPICNYENNKTIILRLDDVKAWQYYDITVRMTNDVLERNMPMTLGVIPQDIEKDTKLFLPWINEVKKNPNIEIALHGYLHYDAEFKDLNESEASYRLMKGNELLLKYVGIIPVTFIPPENLYSEGTELALPKNGFNVLSGGDKNDKSNYFNINEELVFAGKTTETYNFQNAKFEEPIDKIISECKDGLIKTDLCVVVFHPQDYLTSDRRNVDEQKYQEFINLLIELDKLDAEFRNFKDIADCRLYEIE